MSSSPMYDTADKSDTPGALARREMQREMSVVSSTVSGGASAWLVLNLVKYSRFELSR